MSQPPEDPPEGRPDEQWQPPAPPPPPPPTPPPPGQYPGYGPPYDQPAHQPGQPNPYGGGTMSYYGPIDQGGMSRTLKIVLGALIGLFVGFFLWFAAVIGFLGSVAGPQTDDLLLFAALAPLVVPLPLLIWKATRPWAVGLLVGTAVASLALSGLCSAMVSGFEGGV